MQAAKLEQKRPPRPISDVGRSDLFFCGVKGRREGGLLIFWRSGSPTGSFSGNLINRSDLFLKLSATEPDFFRNCRLAMRSFFEILSNRSDLFLQLPAPEPNFFRNPQLATCSFFEILSTLTGLFCCTGARSVMPPSENMMIIHGSGQWERRAMPVFSENPQQPDRSFFRIAGSRVNHFLKSSATCSNFFENCQLMIRTFFGILSSSIDLFLELPARDAIFFTHPQLMNRSSFGSVRSSKISLVRDYNGILSSKQV